MTMMPRPLLACCLAIVIRNVKATKHEFHVVTTKNLIGPIGVPFGFNELGDFKLQVHHFTLDPIEEGNSKTNGKFEAGFLLRRFKNEADFSQYMEVLQTNSSACAFNAFRKTNDWHHDGGTGEDDDTHSDDDEFYSDRSIESARDGIFLSMDVKNRSIEYSFKKGEEGLYFLIYQICGTDRDGFRSTIALEFHFQNFDSFRNPTYLSAGEMKLPLMYFFFSISYFLCFGVWSVNIREIQKGNSSLFPDSGPRPTIYAIHQIMGALVFVKFLAIFFESLRFYVIKVYGHAEVWSVIFYSLTFIKRIFLFTVILLIGTGWSFIKPFINEREKKIILSVLCLQVLNNIVIAILSQETEGEAYYAKLAGLLHLVDIICCCMILVPIVWQVNELEKSVDADTEESPSREAELENGDKGRILGKLKLFRTFYLVVIAYIYSTRILVYLFASLLDYRHLWVRHFVVEIVTLWFYVSVGLMFRPISEANYSGVRNTDIDDGQLDEMELLSGKVLAILRWLFRKSDVRGQGNLAGNNEQQQ